MFPLYLTTLSCETTDIDNYITYDLPSSNIKHLSLIGFLKLSMWKNIFRNNIYMFTYTLHSIYFGSSFKKCKFDGN